MSPGNCDTEVPKAGALGFSSLPVVGVRPVELPGVMEPVVTATWPGKTVLVCELSAALCGGNEAVGLELSGRMDPGNGVAALLLATRTVVPVIVESVAEVNEGTCANGSTVVLVVVLGPTVCDRASTPVTVTG